MASKDKVYSKQPILKEARELAGMHIGCWIQADFMYDAIGRRIPAQLNGEISMITHKKNKRVRIRCTPMNRETEFGPSDLVNIFYVDENKSKLS
jgi:hypothetical protein